MIHVKYSKMIDIIGILHRVMPIGEAVINTDPSTDTDVVDQIVSEKFHPLLFGGDQLTAARARSSQEH